MTGQREGLSVVWINPEAPTRPASTTEAGHLEALAEEAYLASRKARAHYQDTQAMAAAEQPTETLLVAVDQALAAFAKAHHEWTRLEVAARKAHAAQPSTHPAWAPRRGA